MNEFDIDRDFRGYVGERRRQLRSQERFEHPNASPEKIQAFDCERARIWLTHQGLGPNRAGRQISDKRLEQARTLLSQALYYHSLADWGDILSHRNLGADAARKALRELKTLWSRRKS
jgi:hypothetical protein